MILTADEFLRRLPDVGHGGRIVSSADLTLQQISEARVEGRMYVNAEGWGFVLLPRSITTAYDLVNAS